MTEDTSMFYHPDMKHPEERSASQEKEYKQFSVKVLSITSITPPPQKVVYIIIGSMLCEHLCDSGLKSIMALYLKKMLDLEGYQVTIALHSYNFLKYFAVLVGAILADSYFGKVKTILYSQVIYSTGTVLLTISSIIKRAFPNRLVLLLAMITNIIGLGGILPCLVPLAADQISETKEQNKVKNVFIFYFVAVQVCEALSILFVPMMKEVPCLGLETCYPLAFGAPAILSIVSFGLFMSVQKKCFSIPPRQPIFFQGVQCCFHALRMKIKKRKEEPKKKDWLDYADDKFDINFIEAVRCTLSVWSIPIPIYWSLYDQQSTTWTIQASQMDNEIGPLRVLPDQVQALCPILFFIFIPLFHYLLYGILHPLKIFRTLLRRMVVGGFLIALAFLIAFAVQLRIEHSHNLPNKNEGEVRIYNGLNYYVNVSVSGRNILMKPYSYNPFMFNMKKMESKKVEFNLKHSETIRGFIEVKRSRALSFLIAEPHPVKLVKIDGKGEMAKDSSGLIKVRLLCNHQIYCRNLTVSLSPNEWFLKKERNCTIPDVTSNIMFNSIPPGIYRGTVHYKINSIILSKHVETSLYFKTGGEYTLMVYFTGDIPDFSLFVITPPNSVTVLWMLPQYIVLSISGVLFAISAYSFLYTETPDMFKSFSWSACFMTLSAGNMVTVIVGGTPLKPAYNFLLFAGMMLVGMCLFIFAAYKYKYRSLSWLQSKSRIFPIQ